MHSQPKLLRALTFCTPILSLHLVHQLYACLMTAATYLAGFCASCLLKTPLNSCLITALSQRAGRRAPRPASAYGHDRVDKENAGDAANVPDSITPVVEEEDAGPPPDRCALQYPPALDSPCHKSSKSMMVPAACRDGRTTAERSRPHWKSAHVLMSRQCNALRLHSKTADDVAKCCSRYQSSITDRLQPLTHHLQEAGAQAVDSIPEAEVEGQGGAAQEATA